MTKRNYRTEKKPGTFGYNTTFGPGGYTVYRVLTDTAGDIYNASIADFKHKTADFKHKTHAELFRKAMMENQQWKK